MPSAEQHQTVDTPPQPAPSPAGAVDVVHLRELADTHFHEHPHTARMLIEAAAELTRLRSAPLVTEEMVERATTRYDELRKVRRDEVGDFSHKKAMRAGLIAALTNVVK